MKMRLYMSNKKIEDITIKEALLQDISQIFIKAEILSDPAPTFVPITPVIVGKKIWSSVKNLIDKV